MKDYVIGGLVLTILAMWIGIEPVQRFINEATARGTVRGVESCISYTGSELVSAEAIRATCVNRFQINLYGPDHAGGRAGPRLEQGEVVWAGTMQNDTANYVTTWIQLSVSTFDSEGVETEYSNETQIWIDPLGDADFQIALPGAEEAQFEDLQFCDHDERLPTSCMAWGITGVMGLSI